MSSLASQITSLTIVYSIVLSDADQRKHQSSASLAFVRWIHRGPVNSTHKWPVTRKMFPFDDVIMVDSFNSQNPINIRLSAQHVINAICDETMKNSQMYIPCFDTNAGNHDILHSPLRDYVINKMYDTLFGDLIPFIAAKSIGVNIFVITKRGTGYCVHSVKKCIWCFEKCYDFEKMATAITPFWK